MPIYEYYCQACGCQFEVIQKISDSPLTDCSKCGKNSLEKLISSTQFQLKGTGWYVTDFKNSTSTKKETDTTNSEGSSEKQTDAKSTPATGSEKD